MESSLRVMGRSRTRSSPAGTAQRLRELTVSLREKPLASRALLGTVAALVVLAGGWLWLRDSSLVSVQRVRISGVRGTDAPEISQALEAAAKRMTTMDFNVAALRSAVAPFVVVSGVSATTSFPHTVSIHVTERLPVAALTSGGQRTAVATDGTVLGPGLLTSSLPTVNGVSEPTPGAHVSEATVLADLAVLDAAPAPLLRFVARVFEGREGLTVSMRNGLLVYFGNDSRPHAKWTALARVLAAPSSAGAWYVDVRVPERPAAGISGAQAAAPVGTSASDPTAAALAASLATAIGGGASASTTSGSETSGASAGETSSAGSQEAPAAGGAESSGSSPHSESTTQTGSTEGAGSGVATQAPPAPAGPSQGSTSPSTEAVGDQGGSSAPTTTGG